MNRGKIFLYIFIFFAAFGLITQLFGNTFRFLFGLLMMVGFAIVLFALFHFLINRSAGQNNEMKKYRQAVKQSKSKYNTTASKYNVKTSAAKRTPTIRRKGRRRPTHLRVIEGNKSKAKSKENDRATF